MKPISALKTTAVIGEDAGLLHDQPEGFAFEQELEVAKTEESLHRFVQGRQMQG